eukprot:COSAG01_NODE_228_length_21104_cov_210.303832_10_plen_57_part_00
MNALHSFVPNINEHSYSRTRIELPNRMASTQYLISVLLPVRFYTDLSSRGPVNPAK